MVRLIYNIPDKTLRFLLFIGSSLSDT